MAIRYADGDEEEWDLDLAFIMTLKLCVLEIEVEIFDLVFFSDLIDIRTFSAYFRSLSVWARNGPSRKKDLQQLVCRAAQVPGGGFFPANHVSPLSMNLWRIFTTNVDISIVNSGNKLPKSN